MCPWRVPAPAGLAPSAPGAAIVTPRALGDFGQLAPTSARRHPLPTVPGECFPLVVRAKLSRRPILRLKIPATPVGLQMPRACRPPRIRSLRYAKLV